MGRRAGILQTLIRMERAAQRATARAQAQGRREALRAQREQVRYQAVTDKERKHLYEQSRVYEAAAQTEEVASAVSALESLLAASLTRQSFIDLESLKEKLVERAFEPGPSFRPLPAPELGTYLPQPLGGLAKLIPGAKEKHVRKVAEAHARFETEKAAHTQREQQRREGLERARAHHEAAAAAERARVGAQHAEIESLKSGLVARDPQAVAEYFSLVLERGSYPEGFSGEVRLSYAPAQKQLQVDFELPTYDIAPEAQGFKYVKARDEIDEIARPQKERRALYTSLVAQTVLRTLHEIFSADKHEIVEAVVFNGRVTDVDKATGRNTVACVVSVRAPSDTFALLDLARVDALACVRGLPGSMSKAPEALVAVRGPAEWNVIEAIDDED